MKEVTAMSPKNAKPTVQFLDPQAEIPEPRYGGKKQGPPAHWVEVAEHVRSSPGVWHPVVISNLTAKGHASARSAINAASRGATSKTGKNSAFATPGFQAAYREGRLYVRFDAPASVTAIRATA